jgi:hypothetical protein
MKSNSALARNTPLVQSRASINSAPGVTIMDRAGRVYMLPKWPRVGIADIRSWYTRLARRAQSWWRR